MMKPRLEVQVEQRLKNGLERVGFKVLKLVTPGNSGTMDRLILRPKWSPGPPWFVECKRSRNDHERRLQVLVREDWVARGVLVLDVCDSYAAADEIILALCAQADAERIDK